MKLGNYYFQGPLVFFCLAVGIGCRADLPEENATVSQIVGADDRREMSSDLENFIGVIKVADVSICTGFASYRGEITTAAHCVHPNVSLSHYSFTLANGRTLPVQSIHYLNDATDVARLNVAGINQYLPEGVPHDGSLQIYSFARDRGGFVQGVTASFALIESGHLMKYPMDTRESSSGSPIVQDGRVVGVHLGSYGDANVAMVLHGMEDHQVEGRDQIGQEGWKDVAKAAKRVAEVVVDAAIPTAIKELVTPEDTGMDPGEEDRLREIDRGRGADARLREMDERGREADRADPGAALF